MTMSTSNVNANAEVNANMERSMNTNYLLGSPSPSKGTSKPLTFTPDNSDISNINNNNHHHYTINTNNKDSNNHSNRTVINSIITNNTNSPTNAATSSSNYPTSPLLGVSVEVKSMETFAYYPAYIIDIEEDPSHKQLDQSNLKSNDEFGYQNSSNPNNGSPNQNNEELVLVRYPDDWKAPEWTPITSIRPASPPFTPDSFNPEPNDCVEAMAKSSDLEPFSWWKCSIKTVKNTIYLISYTFFDDGFNEIVEKNMLRPANPHLNYEKGDINRVSVPLPNELIGCDWLQLLVSSFNHAVAETNTVPRSNMTPSPTHFQYFLSLSQLFAVHFARRIPALTLIGTSAAVHRSQLLLSLMFPYLVAIYRHHTKLSRMSSECDNLCRRAREGVLIEVQLAPRFMGLIIGKKGQKIKKIEEMEGVLSVRVDAIRGVLVILARNQVSAERAQQMVSVFEHKFAVPKRLLGRVVGKNFAHLKEIEKHSSVIRIRVEERDQPSPDLTNGNLSPSTPSSGTNSPVIPSASPLLPHSSSPSTPISPDHTSDVQSSDIFALPNERMVDLVILGNREAVDDAVLLLTEHCKYLQQISQLTEQH